MRIGLIKFSSCKQNLPPGGRRNEAPLVRIVLDFIKKQEEDLKGKVRIGENTVYQKEMIKTQAELSSQEGKSATLREQIEQLDREIQTLDLFTDWAKETKILVIRKEKGKETRFTVNYKKAMKGEPGSDITLKSGDTIIVP